MKLIFLGAPGSGKGTLSADVSSALSIPTISTGSMLRKMIAEGTELGLEAKSYIDAGKLVPDKMVLSILVKRLEQDDCANGYILDGFPRTIAQAVALEEHAEIDYAVNLEVPYDEIERRMSGRRVCSSCGKTYNIYSMPPVREGVCDDCGGALTIRADDNPETVKARFVVYSEESKPLISYYESRGKLLTVENGSDVIKTRSLIYNKLGIAI